VGRNSQRRRLKRDTTRAEARRSNPPSVSVTPVALEDFGRVAELLSGDRCTVPEGMEHCHGAEVEHSDDTTECHLGDGCEAPEGLHAHGHNCTLVADKTKLRHRCPDCC
jgi:hypothetical protein